MSEEHNDFEYVNPPMRTKEEILEYMDEAFDKVWLIRKQGLVLNVELCKETIDPEIEKEMWQAVDNVCKKYNIDFDDAVSDWDYGFWSGVLATLRWVLGEDSKTFLDT